MPVNRLSGHFKMACISLMLSCLDHSEDAVPALPAARLQPAGPQEEPSPTMENLEAGDAERTKRRCFGHEAALQWRHDRQAVLSEMTFKMDVWAKTVFYELMPVCMAYTLCIFVDGKIAARNRFKSFFPCLVWLPFLDIHVHWWAALGFFVYCRQLLPFTAPYEMVGFMILPLLCRAITLGIKYAMYSNVMMSVDMKGSFKCKTYLDEGIMVQQQMSSYIANFDGKQRTGLMKMLYSSCLYAEADLSCALLTWHTPVPGDQDTSMETRETQPLLAACGAQKEDMDAIRRVWNDVVKMLDGTADASELFRHIDLDHSGDISLSELRAAMTHASEAEVRGHFQAMDSDHNGVISEEEFNAYAMNALEEGRHRESDQQQPGADSHVFLTPSRGLLKCILREDGQTLCQRMLRGQLSCSLVAIHILLSSSTSPFQVNLGFRFFVFCVWPCGLLMAILPAIFRSLMGISAFGSSWQEKLFYCLMLCPGAVASGGILFFAVGPCIWYYRQLCMARSLLDLIEVPRGVEIRWGATPADTSPRLPRLDLRIPSNIEAWTVLRRVIYGRNFSPAIELKFQLYVWFSFGLFLASSAVSSIGQMYSTESFGRDFIGTSIARLVLLAVPLIGQVFLAFLINQYADRYIRALSTACTTIAAAAAALRRDLEHRVKGEKEEEDEATRAEKKTKLGELQDCVSMLDACASEISAEKDALPMRVLYVKAEPAAASMIVSCILTILALQVNPAFT